MADTTRAVAWLTTDPSMLDQGCIDVTILPPAAEDGSLPPGVDPLFYAVTTVSVDTQDSRAAAGEAEDLMRAAGWRLTGQWEPVQSGCVVDVERDDPRLSGAELRVWLDWLGLDAQQASLLLRVRHDTVRRWVTGREPVPVRVGDEMDVIEQATAAAVGGLVDALHDARDPAVVIYRTDADMWAARPEVAPYPASWWRMVVARATAEVPGVEITYSR